MKTVYRNFILLDGRENMTPVKNKVLVIDGEKIEAITDRFDIDENTRILDLGGRYLMPGLINLHVHLPAGGKPSATGGNTKALVKLATSSAVTRKICLEMCRNFAMQELLSGVTTVRTVGGVADLDTRLRDMINSGKTDGPRILASNNAIGPKDGHMVGSVAVEANTEEECREAVRKLAEQKVDLIKIMITGGVLDATVMGEPGVLKMPPELVRACCDEAHKLGFKVAAHVESAEGIHVAAENGVDTVEHGAPMDEHTIECLQKHGAACICTVSPALPLAKFSRDVTRVSEMVQYNSNVVFEGIIEGAKNALEHNIPVGLGTDTGCPFVTHYNMWRELVYFQKYVGVSSEFALYTATLGNAKIAGVDHITGSIEVGKSADILVTDTNPLEDFETIRNPYCVIMRGKRFMKPEIKKNKLGEDLLDKAMP
ncbi:MAG: amidohydrolase family protein [Oscillospiraceae bacterium]|nr:amidohydrolase family protein [Oscillospiraceae bacterium]